MPEDIIAASSNIRTPSALALSRADSPVEDALDSLAEAPISSETLQGQQDFSFEGAPDTQSTPQQDALEGAVQVDEDQFTQGLQTRAEQSEEGAADSLESLINTFEGSRGLESFRLSAEEESGLREREAELLDINDQIRREQHALRRAVEQARKNVGGGSSRGVAIEIENLRRESLSKQADLSIIQMAAQGRFDSAKAIADRKANAIFEAQERDLAFRQFIYSENKSLFEKDEQRLFETQLADRERELQEQRADEVALQATKIEALRMAQLNGASPSILSAIQLAKTPEEVVSVGGRFGSVDLLERAVKEAQLEDLRTKKQALAPTSVIDQGGRKLLINTQTGEVIKDFGVSGDSADALSTAVTQNKISQMDSLKSHKGMRKAVGPSFLGRFTPLRADVLTGELTDFTASVDQLTKELTKTNLIDAKAQGATFGALSEKELSLLADSATKINSWRRTDDDGNTKFFKAAEDDFMAELDKITNFAKLDAVLKGVPPETVGVVENREGFWVQNGDGTIELIRGK